MRQTQKTDKNPAAVAMALLRAAKLSKAERQRIARLGAEARWAKARKSR